MAKGNVAQAERLTELPGIGVCPHDLHHAASMVARAFGATGNDVKEADILKAAINQAAFDIEAVAGALGERCEHYHVILGIKDRLECAAETAEILEKLMANIGALS